MQQRAGSGTRGKQAQEHLSQRCAHHAPLQLGKHCVGILRWRQARKASGTPRSVGAAAAVRSALLPAAARSSLRLCR
jgi:hypothetical protein